MTISAIQSVLQAQYNLILDANIDTIIIDSRKVVFAQHAIFVCLVTDNDNGHYYIDQAYQKGIRCFLISEKLEEVKYKDASFLLVQNTLQAIQQLVVHHRKEFFYPTIGITGSNGKTIVKEWLFQILDGEYQIVRNPKSFNSQIGVALSVWEMQAQHTLAIFEAGISMPNEMQNLQKMIAPTIGIFTNIGEQHSDNFHSIESKIKEKLMLFKDCKVLICNADAIELMQYIVKYKNELLPNTQLLTWGIAAQNALQIISISKEFNKTKIAIQFDNTAIDFVFPFSDDASIENICNCIATALYLRIPIPFLQEKVANIQSITMRMELKDAINNCSIINDSYNNDIGALHIALNYLEQQQEHQKFTVILSDILQSNKSDYSLYEEVSDLLQQKNITKLIGIGQGISKAKHIFRKNKLLHSTFFESTEAYLMQMDSNSFKDESILLKGARIFQFEKINLVLEAKIHQTVLEVNMNALVENYQTYNHLLKADVAIMAMVKAFSYGSGAYEVANKLQFLGVDYLAVAYADEGVLLRDSGIHTPMMVMNPDIAAFDALIRYQLEPEIYSLSMLQHFIAACIRNGVHHYPIHLKIDTGMHRLGFTPEDMQLAIPIILQNNCIKIKSVFSHLAASDDPSLDEFTALQAQIFDTVIASIQTQIEYPFFKHICNTSGIVRHPNLHYNMVRLGVGLYGVDYSNLLGKKIKNISRLKTTIAQIKILKSGDTVGYSRKGLLTRDSKIGTVCIGYADGISRTLGNGKGKMLVNGVLCPIVGNVCMDMCMLDITDVPNASEGNEVIIFGPELPITRVAEMAGTIAYEIMTDISTRVKRVYFEE
jgi:Alr-MurF fusion protein